jgi:hypothetical protein
MPGVGRCHVWKHSTHIVSDALSWQWPNERSLIERPAVRLGSRKYLLFIFRSHTNYTTNPFPELNTSALIHCTYDVERTTSRPREKSRCPLNRRMGRSQSRSGPLGEKKKSRPSGFRTPDRSRRKRSQYVYRAIPALQVNTVWKAGSIVTKESWPVLSSYYQNALHIISITKVKEVLSLSL